MASGRLFLPGWMPARDSNGAPIPNVRAYFYKTDLTELASVYADESLTIPLANPVLANSSGRFPAIWASDALAYDYSVEASYGPPGTPFTGTGLTVAVGVAGTILQELLAALEIAEGLIASVLGTGHTGRLFAAGGETTLEVEEEVSSNIGIALYRNGVFQEPGIDWNWDGTNVITLTDAAEAGDYFFWIHTGGNLSYSPLVGVVTPEMFGAVGDGVTDDRPSWEMAISRNKIVQGDPEATYRLSGELDITNAKIRDAKFLDTRSTTNRKTLKANACPFVMLHNVTVDWGTNGAAGSFSSAAAIQLSDVAEVDLDVKVTGKGKGKGVELVRCGGVLKSNCYDMTAGTSVTARPSDDIIEAVHLVDCEGLSVYPRWSEIGTVWTGQESPAWAYTRGLSISGGNDIDVFAPDGRYCDQHIDISGDLNPGRIAIHGGSVRYGRYFGCKIANSGSRITVNNLRAYRMGLTAFVVSSTNDGAIPEADQPFDIRFIDCLSEETGYDQAGYAYGGAALSNATGFKCEVGDEYLTWPRGVLFVRPRVIGGGVTHFAFSDQTSEYDDPLNPGTKIVGNAGPYRNRITDWKAEDCITANNPQGFLTGRSKVSMTAPVSVPNGGSPTVFTFNQEPDNGMILLRTSSGASASASEVVIRYAGRFLVTGTVLYAANGTGDRRCEIGVNGVRAGDYRVDQRASATLETTVRLTAIVTLNAGDTLSVSGLQDSGGALNASAALEITDLKHQTGEIW